MAFFFNNDIRGSNRNQKGICKKSTHCFILHKISAYTQRGVVAIIVPSYLMVTGAFLIATTQTPPICCEGKPSIRIASFVTLRWLFNFKKVGSPYVV